MRLREILLNNAGAIERKPPLTPEKARRAPERKAGVSKRIRERQSACAKKPRDLRPDL
jgi:hypothetical protein